MGSCTKLRKRHTFVASGQGKPPCFLGSAVVETALPKNNTWGKERRNQREVLKCCGLVFSFGVVCVCMRACVRVCVGWRRPWDGFYKWSEMYISLGLNVSGTAPSWLLPSLTSTASLPSSRPIWEFVIIKLL